MNAGPSGAALWLSLSLPNFLSGCMRGAFGGMIHSGGTGSAFMSYKINICASRETGTIWLRKRVTPSRGWKPQIETLWVIWKESRLVATNPLVSGRDTAQRGRSPFRSVFCRAGGPLPGLWGQPQSQTGTHQ